MFTKNNEAPAWLWLWFPILILIFIALVYCFDHKSAQYLVGNEKGLIEPLTAVILLPGIFFGVQCFRRRRLLTHAWILGWMMLVALACVYFAGEELSWGQQLFGWQSPELMQEINDQQETNIHNISSWFDQKPRILLELWVLIGGIVLPLWRLVAKKAYTKDSWQYWFWPTTICLPTALLAIIVKLPERLEDMFQLSFSFHLRYSELQEFYFALFLALYLYSCSKRLKEG